MISEIITWDTHLHYSTQRSHVSQAKGIKCSRFPATSTLPANFKRRQEIEFIEKCSCDNFCFRFESAAHFRYIIFVFGSSQPPTFGTICQFHPKILEELDITYYYGTQMPGDRWNNVTCAYCKEKFKNDKSQISCQTSQGNQMFKNP